MVIHDISVQVSPELVVWPTENEPAIRQTMRLPDDPANVSEITFGVHTGTHVDAPYHCMAQGSTVSEIPLQKMIGAATVVALTDCDVIGVSALERIDFTSWPRRVLFKTRNSDIWSCEDSDFRSDFVALSPSAAEFLVQSGVALVGIDYLSIQLYAEPAQDTHLTLFRAGVVVLEGLDLSGVQPGDYQLLCLPLKIAAPDAAPARVVLLEE